MSEDKKMSPELAKALKKAAEAFENIEPVEKCDISSRPGRLKKQLGNTKNKQEEALKSIADGLKGVNTSIKRSLDDDAQVQAAKKRFKAAKSKWEARERGAEASKSSGASKAAGGKVSNKSNRNIGF